MKLTKTDIEDAVVWALSEMMTLETIFVSPKVYEDYNKETLGKEDIFLVSNDLTVYKEYQSFNRVELRPDESLSDDLARMSIISCKLPSIK
jgi:hypothetical protein